MFMLNYLLQDIDVLFDVLEFLFNNFLLSEIVVEKELDSVVNIFDFVSKKEM